MARRGRSPERGGGSSQERTKERRDNKGGAGRDVGGPRRLDANAGKAPIEDILAVKKQAEELAQAPNSNHHHEEEIGWAKSVWDSDQWVAMRNSALSAENIKARREAIDKKYTDAGFLGKHVSKNVEKVMAGRVGAYAAFGALTGAAALSPKIATAFMGLGIFRMLGGDVVINALEEWRRKNLSTPFLQRIEGNKVSGGGSKHDDHGHH